jgi:hypothetical protein
VLARYRPITIVRRNKKVNDEPKKVDQPDKASADDLKQIPGGLTPDELEKVSGGAVEIFLKLDGVAPPPPKE